MSVKHIGLSVVVVALCGLGMAQGQGPAQLPRAEDVVPLFTPTSSDNGGYPNGAPVASSPEATSAGTTAGGVAVDEGSPPIPPPVLPPLGLPASPWLVY